MWNEFKNHFGDADRIKTAANHQDFVNTREKIK